VPPGRATALVVSAWANRGLNPMLRRQQINQDGE